MIYENFKSFPKAGKLLGVDWGTRRGGAAVSSPDRKFVFARPEIMGEGRVKKIKWKMKNEKGRGGKTMPASSFPLSSSLLKLIKEENIAGIVVGLPLRLDGTESDTTAKVRAFAAGLDAAIAESGMSVPIVLFDESLTSFEASSVIRRPSSIDSESARVLLENAIAMMNRIS